MVSSETKVLYVSIKEYNIYPVCVYHHHTSVKSRGEEAFFVQVSQ